MPDIVDTLELAFPRFSLFSILCFVFAVAGSIALVAIAVFRRHLYMRLAVVVAALLHVFFQWPLFVVSNAVESSLDNRYFYFGAVQFSVFSLLVFAWITRRAWRLNGRSSIAEVGGAVVVVPIVICLLLVLVYLNAVPFGCTALFAVIFDPGVALLARELSIKLSGSYIGAVSYGAITNAVSPVIVALAIAGIWNAISSRTWWRVGAFSCAIVGAVTASLLSGAKGLLLPTLIVVVVVGLQWGKTNFAKVGFVLASVALMMSSLVMFEVFRDRLVNRSGGYEFGKCVVRLEACRTAQELVMSLYERSGSLGVSDQRRDLLKGDLQLACAQGDAVPRVNRSVAIPSVSSRVPETPEIGERKKLENVSGSGLSLGHSIEAYTQGVLYRAFVTPVQVASWHYLYVSEFGSPGVLGISWLRKLLGETTALNMPELVYQAYGSRFSGGDRTSTSTSPTTFLVAYPAYLGGAGIALAVVIVLITDAFAAALMARVSAPLRPICSGLVVIMAFNFLLSDFPTVMTSHGGLASLAIIALFRVTPKRL